MVTSDVGGIGVRVPINLSAASNSSVLTGGFDIENLSKLLDRDMENPLCLPLRY